MKTFEEQEFRQKKRRKLKSSGGGTGSEQQIPAAIVKKVKGSIKSAGSAHNLLNYILKEALNKDLIDELGFELTKEKALLKLKTTFPKTTKEIKPVKKGYERVLAHHIILSAKTKSKKDLTIAINKTLNLAAPGHEYLLAIHKRGDNTLHGHIMLFAKNIITNRKIAVNIGFLEKTRNQFSKELTLLGTEHTSKKRIDNEILINQLFDNLPRNLPMFLAKVKQNSSSPEEFKERQRLLGIIYRAKNAKKEPSNAKNLQEIQKQIGNNKNINLQKIEAELLIICGKVPDENRNGIIEEKNRVFINHSKMKSVCKTDDEYKFRIGLTYAIEQATNKGRVNPNLKKQMLNQLFSWRSPDYQKISAYVAPELNKQLTTKASEYGRLLPNAIKTQTWQRQRIQ